MPFVPFKPAASNNRRVAHILSPPPLRCHCRNTAPPAHKGSQAPCEGRYASYMSARPSSVIRIRSLHGPPVKAQRLSVTR